MGREKFADLWEKVEELKSSLYTKLCLYGTSGYGKPHILAALACLLTRSGDRVLYLPDCRIMLDDPVEYVMTAMLTFADDIKIQREIKMLKAEASIKSFFNKYRHPMIFFLADQINASSFV